MFLKNVLLISLLALTIPSFGAHVQWEADGIPYVHAPKFNPGVDDPDLGTPLLKERTLSIRGLTMDFKKIGHVQLELINSTTDLDKVKSWTIIERIDVISGFAKVHRATGMNHFYIEGNGPIMIDILVKVAPETDPQNLIVKIKSPYK